MAQTQYYPQETRDPATAAMLSMIPGLGQFYNGQSRKGILFLDVAILNYILLSMMLLAPGITKALEVFGKQYGMKVNDAVIEAFRQIHFGSPVSLLVTGMVLAFVGYAARDAYDHAIAKRRRAIYKDMVIELPEATSGSYILHAALIVSLAILAMFFFIPQPPAKQITMIEFIDNIKPTIVKPPVNTNIRAQESAKLESKKFDKTKPIQKLPTHAELNKDHDEDKKNAASSNSRQLEQQKSTSSSSSSSSASQPQHRVQQTVAKETPEVTKIASAAMPPAPLASLLKNFSMNKATPTAPTLQNTSSVQATVNPLPKAMSSAAASASVPVPIAMNPGQSPLPALPTPSMFSSGSMRNSGANPTPMPAGAASGSNHGLQLPSVAAPQLGGKIAGPPAGGTPGTPGSRSNGFSSGIGPEAISHADTTGGGPSVTPVDMRGRGHKPGTDGDGDNKVPAPFRAGGHGPSSFTSGPITLTPSFGGPTSGPGPEDNIPGPPGTRTSPPVKADPDFSKYMLELQRRIKRAWFPPSHTEKNRVKVLFKIHANGEMSNLRITESSGLAIADQAALAAVRNAAPFAHLPENSPENVDIEFTFDYNVFKSM